MPGMPLRRIVVLTGAGISAESGLRTFRDAGGLWENHRVEEVATPEAFAADPDLVHRFYNERRRQLSTVGPNAAHLALARLEAALGDRLLLVTQNVDDLHERAGSRTAVHMHGELRRIRCSACGTVLEYDGDSSPAEACSGCGSPGTLRPHVVWFGEMPLELEKIFEALERCDLFAAVGTSGNVYPAAGFVQVARESGARTVEINLEPSEVSAHFDEARIGPAGLLVPRWVEELLGAAEEWGQS